MSELKIIDLFIICHECRKVFTGKNVTLNTPCPDCGTTDFAYIKAEGIVDAVENEMALEAILAHSNCAVVHEVANVMGYSECGSRDSRNNDSHLKNLKEWLEDQE